MPIVTETLADTIAKAVGYVSALSLVACAVMAGGMFALKLLGYWSAGQPFGVIAAAFAVILAGYTARVTLVTVFKKP